jgi:hypothetical protein
MSVEAFGTVVGVQFEAEFQSPFAGHKFQFALPACVADRAKKYTKRHPKSRKDLHFILRWPFRSDHCQGEIVAVAAAVAGLEAVAAHTEDGSVGQVGKGAADRRAGGVADHAVTRPLA